MSVSVVLALGFALVGSLCLLAHTIYRRPTSTSATPTSNRKRFPIVGSEPTAARDAQAPEGLGEVNDAYRAWLHNLDENQASNEPNASAESAAANAPAR